jgi:hypothetical protein
MSSILVKNLGSTNAFVICDMEDNLVKVAPYRENSMGL